MLLTSRNIKPGDLDHSLVISVVLFVFEQVFFTRNGKVVGRREVALPVGGLYPTIGMMSTGEKVRVDLHPLSG